MHKQSPCTHGRICFTGTLRLFDDAHTEWQIALYIG